MCSILNPKVRSARTHTHRACVCVDRYEHMSGRGTQLPITAGTLHNQNKEVSLLLWQWAAGCRCEGSRHMQRKWASFSLRELTQQSQPSYHRAVIFNVSSVCPTLSGLVKLTHTHTRKSMAGKSINKCICSHLRV